MRFYKSLWFWTPLIICLVTGILLQIMVSRGLAENTSNSPPGVIGGLIAGLALGFFLWMIFGKIDKVKIPENIENGFKFQIAGLETTDFDKIKLKNIGIFPELIICPNKLKYRIFSEGYKEVKYSDIKIIEIISGFLRKRDLPSSASNLSLKFEHHEDIKIHLKNNHKITIFLHRKSNLIELLKFLKNKHVPFSENAENLMQNQY